MASCQPPFVDFFSGSQPERATEEATTSSGVTPAVSTTPADTAPVPPQPSVITLTLWTIERFSPQDDIIAQQLAQFEREHPDIKVNVLLKRTSGQASALNFLKSAKPVAPAVLPDIVVLNTDDLAQAWRGKLIQPLDGLLDREIVQDLLPAAQRLGTIDDNLAGIPFELDVEHMVYNTSKVFTTPVIWRDVLSNVNSYQFPADGRNGLLNDSLLIQYLSAGARLVDDQGKPIIDEPALRALLNYYQALRDDNIIDAEIVSTSYASELWRRYLAGLPDMTHINAHQYLNDYRLLASTRVAPIPSQNGEAVAIGHGWVFALVTPDEVRQIAALKLISVLIGADNNAAWANRAAVIPARRAAFDQIAGSDPYWTFLREYLETTRSQPAFTGYDQLSRILLIAIQQVISGEAAPDEAIATAIQALDQSTP